MNIKNKEGVNLTLAEVTPQALKQADLIDRWFGYSIKPRTNQTFWILNQKFRCLPKVNLSGKYYYPIENCSTLQFVFSEPCTIFFNACTILKTRGDEL